MIKCAIANVCETIVIEMELIEHGKFLEFIAMETLDLIPIQMENPQISQLIERAIGNCVNIAVVEIEHFQSILTHKLMVR